MSIFYDIYEHFLINSQAFFGQSAINYKKNHENNMETN